MYRRELLKLGAWALAGAPLTPILSRFAPRLPEAKAALFYAPAEAEAVRLRAASPLLSGVYAAWRDERPGTVAAAVARVRETGDLLVDLRNAAEALTRAAVVQIVEPSEDRAADLRAGIDGLSALPKWDYFLDGPGEDAVVGIMRASLVTARLLFARDVLGGSLGAEGEGRLLTAVAEKGCAPCARTITGMNNPASVDGWRFDANHQGVYEIDMSRWPEILGANNLRAIPTMGLGLGALALEGRDPRAGAWVALAEDSARRVFGTFSSDGSYFEGLSYVDYALRTLLAFLEAHERRHGTIAWERAFNAPGLVDFIVAMQAGVREDGMPDIVNFSDARRSTYPCVPAWVARRTGSPLARWAARHASEPGYYLDFLWYDPDAPEAAPPDHLLNKRLDLDWIVCRTGWDADDAVLAFRSGGPANHEHADRNAFFFKVYGERLLNDHFGAAYDWRDAGWLLRLTEAHNAVLIDGRGHQYHNGEEGTNESLASACVTRYHDDGPGRAWWTSDATAAYRLVDLDVVSVTRTIAFAGPDVVVLLDRVVKRLSDSSVALRFFPDNRDGAATVETTEAGFTIRRPRARLHVAAAAASVLSVGADRLDLPENKGVFPYVEVESPAARVHEVLTVMLARPGREGAAPHIMAEKTGAGWRFEAGGVAGTIDDTPAGPTVRWG